MYVGVPTAPPPPPRGARRLTACPADPQGLGQPKGWGGSPSPPIQPPKRSHSPRGHKLAGGGPRGWVPSQWRPKCRRWWLRLEALHLQATQPTSPLKTSVTVCWQSPQSGCYPSSHYIFSLHGALALWYTHVNSGSLPCAPLCGDPLYHMLEMPTFPSTVLSTL